ncbi:MAG: hypothetical protein LH468_10895 [Nocardioides sp.]|nr:hypothetical protein [Nocardioides sp.]
MRPQAPPRALVWAAAVVVVTGVAITVAGAWRTGVSWDETYHVMRMQNFLADGWFLLDADLDAGRPGAWVDQRYVYAPVTMILLHAWSLLCGVDTRGLVSTTDQAYAVRHLGVVLISLVGTAATAVLARLLLRSWGWAAVCVAVLVAVPTWTGHAMFNVKDVPVATGYTLVTLGVCVVCRVTASGRWVAAGALTTTAGLLLAVGTRPGVWPGVAVAGGIGVVLLLVRRRWARAGLLVAVAAAAVGVLVLVYPAAFADPVTALVAGALESSRYGGQQGSWWYLPLYLVIELPTGLLLLGGVGALVLARVVARRQEEAAALVAGLVLLQTFLLPALALAREANLYTGLRQLLFAAPGLAVLVTVALAVAWGRRSQRPRRSRALVPAFTALAVGVPVLVQAQLFPYSYAFSSLPASIVSPRLAAQDRDLEVQTDYWRTSVRELARSVPVHGFVTCTPRIDDTDRFLPRSEESREDCGTDPIGPLAPYDATRAVDRAISPDHFLAVDAGSAFVGQNCAPLHRVTRRLWWRTVTMSSVSECDLVLADYPAAGATFDGAGQGADYLRGAWSMLRPEPGAGLTGPGLVGFTLPAGLADRPVVVTGTGLGVQGLSASANGWPVPVRTDGDAFAFDVPAAASAAYGGARLVLSLSDTAPADLRLLSLDLSLDLAPDPTPGGAR